MKDVDVAIIGAGHAGLNALKEVRKVTDNWVVINFGALGTTCARVGCMPSKALIELGNRQRAEGRDIPDVLAHTRDLRDIFVDLVLANSTDTMTVGEEVILGDPTFTGPTRSSGTARPSAPAGSSSPPARARWSRPDGRGSATGS